MTDTQELFAVWHDQSDQTYHMKYNGIEIVLESGHPYRDMPEAALIRAARVAYLRAARDGVTLTPESWLTGIGIEAESERKERERWERLKATISEANK